MRDPELFADLQKMHRMAAALVVADPVYLPLFERVERELALYQSEDDAISRARAIAALHNAAA
ncbi:hypothetical protein BMG03_10055 [Thioclava nitratireducens]|uniref:Uncharacterized protein n=1 Tax=Thioclava nitratireducens TaxID=1915078 RepID=A0ABN4XEY2_9RHOB|nr:hypothetical protein [Thioclava nitratireducens]AQS48106.1 hypothetical protein BMG03_10055 [Thioclava nitratireducens]